MQETGTTTRVGVQQGQGCDLSVVCEIEGMPAMKERPLYCPDLKDDEDCPACGATAERGVCQAIRRGPAPKPLVEVILIDKRTGGPV